MKNFFLGVLMVFFANESVACDHCNLFLNMNPNDYKNTLGIQYRTRLLAGSFAEDGTLKPKHAGHVTNEMAGKSLTELYSRYEVTGNFFINKLWSIQAILPLINNVQAIDGLAKYNVWGVGDPVIMGSYQIFNTKNTADSIKFAHRLTAGLGVKIPFGSTSYSSPFGKPNLDLQPGSGSWDGLVILTYIAKVNSFGLFVNANYKLNTANRDQYQYGNTFNSSVYFFYQKKLNERITIMPTLGIYTEMAGFDKNNATKEAETGGENFLGDIGLTIFMKKIRLSANFQPLLASNMRSATQIDIKNRMIFSLNYNF
jgi:hypothetical protein